MTAFLIVSIILFLLSIFANVVFILNENTTSKGGAIIGLVVFTAMIVWAISLIF